MKNIIITKYDTFVNEQKNTENKINLLIESALVIHAETELKLADMIDSDDEYNNMVSAAVIELIKKFSEQGHSGFSAQMVRQIFNKLTNWETLTDITSNEDEWNNDLELGGDGNLWQNKRNPAVFSKDGGQTWYNLDDKDLNIIEKLVVESISKHI